MAIAMHSLIGVLFLKEENMMLCIDQFDNEMVLTKDGEPAYAEWEVYNYVEHCDTTMITTPLPFLWKLSELPFGYEGELFVGMTNI